MLWVDDLPSKAAIFDHWKDRLRPLGLFIDWGEPSCWACGFHYGSKYDIRRSDAGWDEIFACWESMPLPRCHIVPRSLGGGNGVENLFLMCRECHDTAPNTDIPDIFFEWARSQSSFRREAKKYDAALEAFGLSEADWSALGGILESDEFRAWCQGRSGLHRPQSNYAPVSARLTPATAIGLAVHYQRALAGDTSKPPGAIEWE